ncbi:MAG: lipid-A-disaccharide synthase [Thermogutta sp.]
MLLFFSAGEPSGDQHASELLREMRTLDDTVRAVGFGGPRLRAAGCELFEDLTQHAVMWFRRAGGALPYYRRLYLQAETFFREQRPDAVILIDYPGFNWWVAHAAKKHGVPVFYYVPPQIWSWARWRVAKMRRLIDHTFACLPFEARWFQEHRCPTTYVGHPSFDELARHAYDEAFVRKAAEGGPLLTVLPGSRNQEVEANAQVMHRCVERVRRAVPEVRVAVAAFRESHAARFVAKATGGNPPAAQFGDGMDGVEALPGWRFYVGRTPELIRAATSCLSVSGSVSLELLYQEKPGVIVYQINPFAFWVQNRFRRVRYITLVNLLADGGLDDSDLRLYDPRSPRADRAVFPEYLTYRDRSEDMAKHLIEWLTEPRRREQAVQRLAALKRELDWEGASSRAAHAVLQAVERHRSGESPPTREEGPPRCGAAPTR